MSNREVGRCHSVDQGYMTDGRINIIAGLVATAAGLLAAWVATMPQNSLPYWLSPLLLLGAVATFSSGLLIAAFGVRRYLREPARTLVVEGSRVEIIALWDAITHFRKATKWGEASATLRPEHIEWQLNQMCIERFLDENRLGHLAFYGRVPRAHSYRVIRIDEIADWKFGPYQSQFMEENGGVIREDVSVDYSDLLRLVSKTIKEPAYK